MAEYTGCASGQAKKLHHLWAGPYHIVGKLSEAVLSHPTCEAT